MFNPRTTLVRKVDPAQPDGAVISEAASLLRRGGLVAFPTETVYGLGANALDPKAVRSIFDAKERPPTNPIIVHVADALSAQLFARDWPAHATTLAKNFWPGSLTIVVNKQPMVPDIATADGPTVGLRVPAHPIALALLRAADIPIAAPSANRSTQISPTTGQHVLRGLDDRIDMLVDAGQTAGGLESTVIDLTVSPPRLLRPGLVTVAQIEAVIGKIDASGHATVSETGEPLRSPGLLERHYAPKAQVVCLPQVDLATLRALSPQVNRLGCLRLLRAGTSAFDASAIKNLTVIDMPSDPAQYSAKLYAALHELDAADIELIAVDLPPEGDAWRAVHDRLQRASRHA
jgi:L-threonylcarbamoyladenylate synthase